MIPVASSGTASWRLLWLVVTPFWAFMFASRMLAFNLATAVDPRIIIAPPHLRVLQHLLLLPLLVVFLRYAVAIGWPATQRIRALLLHAGMAVLFSFLARPILVGLVASDRSNVNLLDELFRSIIGPNMSVMLWFSTIGDFLLSYLAALLLVLFAVRHLEYALQLRRARGLENEWIRGRLNALQLRGNSQFVFNVLRDAADAVPAKPAKAQDLLVRLARLLQRTVSINGEDLVPVRQEIEAAREYLEIQRLRFPGMIRSEFRVDNAAQDCLVPALVIQPLVEDVLVRSQSSGKTSLALLVRVRRSARGVEIEVRADHAAEAVAAPQAYPAIDLIRERLDRLFGERSASIEAADDPQISVNVQVPVAHG